MKTSVEDGACGFASFPEPDSLPKVHRPMSVNPFTVSSLPGERVGNPDLWRTLCENFRRWCCCHLSSHLSCCAGECVP
ncbi:hypothetical protein XENOCAPTIV_027996 [Xenoophorus captivus]|uniref:Hepcidin n=1 Tax=Xenoophorus captivus TaxID=1517983 RepID=A0ABV0S9D2_9TELE